jgi:predicted acylesterase/phospholipase RssA
MNHYQNNSNSNINNNPNNTLSRKKPIENVLVLQGGGSLGAFACGVFKALDKKI